MITLAQQNMIAWLQHAPVAVFVFCVGACVGSFVNVVIYRLPSGMSVISPPSRCPTCGARLRFFRENLPILGWFMVRGRCRYCHGPVSAQYMLIELLMALVFLGLYVLLFVISWRTPWWGEIGGQWWHVNGFLRAWPAFTVLAFLVAGLVAMTLIDARSFTIPIQIPLFVTGTAFIGYPVQALLPTRHTPAMTWPIPGTGWSGLLMAGLGVLGVVVAAALLKLGKLRYSFADYGDYVKEGEVLGDYPHARREMWLEVQFLTPCMMGIAIGWLASRWMGLHASPPPFLQALGATFLGYLVGGGLVWTIRILGTLAFGREAMGLGDVHLLAAVGAALGWFDPILIFFLAPFSGILWVLLSMSLASMLRRSRRELPYGPHLAAATVIVIFLRPGIDRLWEALAPNLPLPTPGLLP